MWRVYPTRHRSNTSIIIDYSTRPLYYNRLDNVLYNNSYDLYTCSLPDVDDFKIRGPENWTLKKTTKVFSNSSLVVVSLENGNLEEIGELSVNVTSTTSSAICEAELYAQEGKKRK